MLHTLTIQTSNGVTRASSYNYIQVKAPNFNTIRTNAYSLPQNKHNLLSLADVLDELGAVVFILTGAYATQPDKI